jgi:small nuclear ribonucleoprotein (snRNP)-like protein
MNMVLDDATEVTLKTKDAEEKRRQVGAYQQWLRKRGVY